MTPQKNSVSTFLIVATSMIIMQSVNAKTASPTNSTGFTSLSTEQSIIPQGQFQNGCGFACILNSLRFGTADKMKRSVRSTENLTDQQKIELLTKNYGSKPSNDYKDGPRLRADGLTSIDLLNTCNEIRQDRGLVPLSGRYMNRGNSTPEQFLKDTHTLLLNSLKLGEPPIISVRSQSAQWNVAKKEYFWEGIVAHALTVVGISALNTDGTFILDCLDPQIGQHLYLFVYHEPRGFKAKKGTEWLDKNPFLSVCGKNLDLGTSKRPWHERSVT